ELPNTDDVKVAQNDPTLKVGFRPPFNTGWVRFNMNNDLFKDKRIRQAVAIAINRQAIVQGLYAGFGEVAQQHMPPSMWGRATTGIPTTGWGSSSRATIPAMPTFRTTTRPCSTRSTKARSP